MFFKKKTIFRKVFFITLTVSLLPLIVSWVYLLRVAAQHGFDPTSAVVAGFYAATGLAILLALGGSYYLSRRISRPITHFIKTATLIARGNFSERVSIESNDEIGRLAQIFNYMTTELRRLRDMDLNRLINEKIKNESILKNLADGVIGVDVTDKIMMLNSVMEGWFGIRERQCLEKPLESCVSNQTLLQFLRKVRDENKPGLWISESEIVIKSTKTWRNIFLQARAAKVVNEKNEMIGIVAILRDVTREKEIDRMKTELVSMVAHELRSPLTSISGFSELLLDPTVNREQSEEYAAIILQVKKVPMQITDVLDKVLDVNLHQAEKKGIVVSVKLAQDIPLVYGDKDMMEQVILNLFNNAVKYSPENTAIEIRLKERENDVLFEIEDNGYGISEKALPRIFEKFYRVTDNDKVREVTGTGLGLSLVKEIVELHNGVINVKSKVGEGSTFFFSIPKYNGKFHDIAFDDDLESEMASHHF
ncbi:hypothetical protein DCC62_08050 [candidate division KSB1 bacterium]|nr:MAG: hypothetical protein DCC62_08050 [candidate division KSB1 bacterium]